ncbi:hypothetical protein [Paenibacillus sp. IHBB 3054]|uniref:hypothetical protein n=1 Tax=Paenibacillus sp. IHBB 3054 TaxID=3425689 RepID=UPI003F67E389
MKPLPIGQRNRAGLAIAKSQMVKMNGELTAELLENQNCHEMRMEVGSLTGNLPVQNFTSFLTPFFVFFQIKHHTYVINQAKEQNRIAIETPDRKVYNMDITYICKSDIYVSLKIHY